jgi:hypothetical protein
MGAVPPPLVVLVKVMVWPGAGAAGSWSNEAVSGAACATGAVTAATTDVSSIARMKDLIRMAAIFCAAGPSRLGRTTLDFAVPGAASFHPGGAARRLRRTARSASPVASPAVRRHGG